MTNAWGGVVGHPAGVTSIKDLFYLSADSDEEAMKSISRAGYKMIEIFDGNLMSYADNKSEFNKLLDANGLSLLAVYTGANFIFEQVLEEEFFKMEQAAKIAKAFGAKHLVFGGGAIRSGGIREEDYALLGKGLDRALEMAQKYNLIASYHPHMGTIVQKPEQLDKIMPLTKINLCPDTGHINVGGGDSVKVVEKYKDRIKYIHLKDYSSGQFLPLGKGSIDFKKIIKILSDNGFDGEYAVEADGYRGNPEDAAKESYLYLSKV